jgi:type IV secretion system protein VirD4
VANTRQSLKDHLSSAIAQRIKDNNPLSDECADALQRLLSNSDNTLSSIVSTFNAPLTIFADAIVDAATSADDFRLEDLRHRRVSIYVRVPPNRLASARPLLNLFFSQLVSLNTQQLPEQDPTLRFQCLLVNDEFAAMGRVGVISTAAAFLAGYNLRLLTVVQAMSQLDALYGEKEARSGREPRHTRGSGRANGLKSERPGRGAAQCAGGVHWAGWRCG